MRITDQTLFRNALAGLTGNLAAFRRAGDQATSGTRLQRLSDGPDEARTVMGLRSRLRSLDRYRGAAAGADVRLSAEDAVLDSVDRLLKQAKDLAATAANVPDDAVRATAIQEIRSIRDQVVSLGNTQVSGAYIFSGGKGQAPAFNPDGSYAGDSNPPVMDLWGGSQVTVNHTGDQALSGALDALDGLERSAEAGDAAGLQASLKNLDQAVRGLRAVRAQTGSRMRSVEESLQAINTRDSVLKDQEQELAGADPTESLLKMSEAKTALDRAYEAVSKVLNTNLLQFLR
jgi:flagellar hook-associated protein 3 FlgL